jgi:epoxyqueuosine reductase
MGREHDGTGLVSAREIAPEPAPAAGRPGAGHGTRDPLRGSRLLSDPAALKDWLVERARAEGFDRVGIAPANAIPQAPARLAQWLSAGHHGDMDWMEARAAERADPTTLWPDVRSIVMLAVNYAPDEDPMASLARPDRAAISPYARRRDYHDVIKGRLKALAGAFAAKAGADVKVFVDTAPVMEKPLAQAAGIGWQGKHSVVIARDQGNWLFLAALYTTAELPPDAPETDHCGSCRRCLDICPTDAFPAPYVLDARRCIAYLTIEHKGPIPVEFRAAIGNRIFGCDDCLAVCPWNKFATVSRETKLALRDELKDLPLAELARLDDGAFRALFAGTPVKRTGRDRFVRNVLIAIGNSGDAALAPVLVERLADASPLVRAMAVWALARLAPHDLPALAARHAPDEPDPDVRAEWDAALTRQPEPA